jgi:shikimate dehydrogenase
MHNAAIDALGLDLIYCPFSVAPDHLSGALVGLKSLRFLGVNLTIPHKEAALEQMDELTDEALAVGAVNTVLVTEKGLRGHNTDPEGFSQPLFESGFRFEGSRTVVLGAGGAARSVVHRLLHLGAEVNVVNRSIQRAEKLVQEIRGRGGNHAAVTDLADSSAVCRLLESADLVVNTTSVGMAPNADAAPLPVGVRVRPEQVYYDLIYRPEQTRFLALAQQHGARTIGGLPMLVSQGAAAFRYWTELEPPAEVMESAARAALGH